MKELVLSMSYRVRGSQKFAMWVVSTSWQQWS